MAKEIVAMILAGGRGSRLYALTQKTAKPAVSFGGKYRIVDFPLSNCVNSNIDTVGIATQYQPQKLNEYIGNGQPWDLDRLYGGVHTLPPYEQAKGTDWYKGTANAIYQNISFIDSYDPEYVIILSGDQICKQDYADFLRFHKEKGAEFSVAVMEVDWKEASRFGLMVADEDDRITEFQEKPPVPKSNLASMGIYIFNWDVLKKYLEEDEAWLIQTAVWNKLWKRSLSDGLRFPKSLYEDMYFTIRLLAKSKRSVYLDWAMYNYVCSRTTSTTNIGLNEKTFNDLIPNFYERSAFLREIGREDLALLQDYFLYKRLLLFYTAVCRSQDPKKKEHKAFLQQKIEAGKDCYAAVYGIPQASSQEYRKMKLFLKSPILYRAAMRLNDSFLIPIKVAMANRRQR